MTEVTPVILCGGSGTRLWPRSRPERPKPFLPLVGKESLFALTLARFAGDAAFAAPLIVAGEEHRSAVEEHLAGAEARLAIEPVGRNTAPAIALAAHLLGDDAIMLVCPSDHHIADVAAFRQTAHDAAELAADGHLVAMGVVPTRPETGYGYIREGEPAGPGYRLARFVEKPDRETAEAYLVEGGYFWNAGIFAFRAGDFLAELETHRPDMARAVAEAAAKGTSEGAAFHPDAAAFAAVPAESIDYAVMENTSRAAMVAADMGWSDIGSWAAVQAARGGDERGNSVTGRADLRDCRNVMVDSDSQRVSVVGLEDVIVIVDGDEVLVTSVDAAQDVGKLDGAKGK